MSSVIVISSSQAPLSLPPNPHQKYIGHYHSHPCSALGLCGPIHSTTQDTSEASEHPHSLCSTTRTLMPHLALRMQTLTRTRTRTHGIAPAGPHYPDLTASPSDLATDTCPPLMPRFSTLPTNEACTLSSPRACKTVSTMS